MSRPKLTEAERLERGRQRARAHYWANREQCNAKSKQWVAEHYEQTLAYNREWRKKPENWIVQKVSEARKNNKNLGVSFTESDQKALRERLMAQLPVTNCEVCGQQLQWGVGKGNEYNGGVPSLDKLEPRLGYKAGNVRIICRECNTKKLHSSLDDLRKIVAYMEHYLKPVADGATV